MRIAYDKRAKRPKTFKTRTIPRAGRRKNAGADPWEAIDPLETYESNFIHHDFVQFGKQHSRYKAILPSVVLSQQCCEVYFISLTVVNPSWDLAIKCCVNRPPPLTLLAGSTLERWDS